MLTCRTVGEAAQYGLQHQLAAGAALVGGTAPLLATQILQFDGKEVIDESHLINMVSLSNVGRKVEVMVWRTNELIKLTVDLMGRPVGSEEQRPM